MIAGILETCNVCDYNVFVTYSIRTEDGVVHVCGSCLDRFDKEGRLKIHECNECGETIELVDDDEDRYGLCDECFSGLDEEGRKILDDYYSDPWSL